MRYRRTYIIAEAGVNHNGSLVRAKQMIDVAAAAGADAVKFQSFLADQVVSPRAPKAEYQKRTTDPTESQYEMIKRLELDQTSHKTLIQHCAKKKIQFLSTPFDTTSLDMLMGTFSLPQVKISSGDITNAPLLLKAAKWKKPVILSTGMSSLSDIETALGILAFGFTASHRKPSRAAFKQAYHSDRGQQALKKMVTLLHCTTEYPAPFEEVNLLAMNLIRSSFGLSVGYSDHTKGFAIAIAAVALGAEIIEKHFTLDRSLPGPDHRASLEPGELKTMVESIRQVERALGAMRKMPTPSEVRNKEAARKSIAAAIRIRKGERFTENNMTVRRPGNGLSPVSYWDILGKQAGKDYEPDEVILQ